MKVLLVSLSLSLLALCLCERLTFEDHRVYRLEPKNAEQLEGLRPLEATNERVIFLNDLHLGAINALIAPSYNEEFLQLLQSLDISPELLDANAQASLSLDIEPVADANRRSDDYSWTEYHELNDTHRWMQNLVEKNPGIVSVFVAGRSYEGRDLLGLRIFHSAGAERGEQQAIFLEAGMHAREWISPATATYFANQLLTSQQPEIQSLARSYVWYILPHANPDGYVYTHSTNRLWRKTRSPQEKNCMGTDPNRNWGFHWNEVGASDEPCSESYAGPKAFSEPETEGLSQYLKSLPEPVFMYLSLHSFSQLLLYPYGHTSSLPENHRQLERIFSAALGGMKRRFGTRYTGGNVYDAIYPAAGSSMDWAYGELKTKYSFTYELRPSGYSFWTGFRLPASQIIPTGQETTDSVVEMVKAAASIEGYKLK
ncbi:zinc carboxypeptidase A 1 [Drosophila pseudoobscura]|uniref:Zinc carboxypeptidase A 1 n=1 Tax=Drosophila pseudoobscura pseudoobscura TaxID=46245 RepID=A0A6I8UJG3_DROPS|nr:zinc carboxypeptidase A 1 [Drosophila pseudoobscura]